MIFYLDNEDKFLLYVSAEEVVFIHYCSVLNGPTKADLRWKGKNIFENKHMKSILRHMQSDDLGDRNIGLKMLEQTLKVVIDGEIVGNQEEQFI